MVAVLRHRVRCGPWQAVCIADVPGTPDLDAHDGGSVPPLPPPPTPAASPYLAPPRRAKRLFGMPRSLAVILIVVLVLVVAGVVASQISVPYYAITPGQAQDVSGLIVLPKGEVHQHPGGVYLTDVYLRQLSALDYPIFDIDSQASVVQSSDVIGFVPVSEYNTEGVIDMSDATQAATYVALHELGYDVTATSEGEQLYEIDPASNAFAVLTVGDVVVAVDGQSVTQQPDISKLILAKKPGDTVRITFRPYTAPLTGAEKTVTVALGEYRLQDGNYRCYPVGQGGQSQLVHVPGGPFPYPCIGVELYAFYKLGHLPFQVTIDPEGIVGPSAGLAFTLGLMEELDTASLTDGRRVAATGTMSLDGTVGAVGGVAQKTIAVENAGATVFFVPKDNYAAALIHKSSSLTVVPVTSLQQALTWLLQHGGRIGIPGPSQPTS
jgi:Lon-like protease